MVVAIRPGRFYGGGLPRPWFHADVVFNEERVDPPLPVLAPLLHWAREAHWSMGGLSFQRRRLQGRIEGSIKKLRAEKEKATRKADRSAKMMKRRHLKEERSARKRKLVDDFSEDEVSEESAKGGAGGLTPRQLRQQRRWQVAVADSDNSEPEEGEPAKRDVATPDLPSPIRRKSARKLGDEFDRLASRSPQKEICGTDASPTPDATATPSSSPRLRPRKQGRVTA